MLIQIDSLNIGLISYN